MKVTVGDLKESGFKLVVGDEILNLKVSPPHNFIIRDRRGVWLANGTTIHDTSYIFALSSRKNTGKQPVNDDCVVEVTYDNGMVMTNSAGLISWQLVLRPSIIKSWKPSLKHLEQQMKDKQESAMSISERDIENAFIKQEDAEVERELSESCDWKYGDECITENGNKMYIAPYPFEDGMHIVADEYSVHRAHVSVLSKPLTPEQLVAKELFELSFEPANLSGVKAPCVYEWGRLSEKEKNYWVIFSKTINFKQDR